jgi:transketolase
MTPTFTCQDLAGQVPRSVFGMTFVQLAEQNENIVAISPDLMISTRLAEFVKKYPHRFFETGVTEQAAVGIAAGLATCGLIPFVCQYAPFVSMRACEQVRTDIAYPNLNVKIIGTHAGMSPGAGGATHLSLEDIAILRAVPNLTILAPSDNVQTAKAVRLAAAATGPVYVRLVRGSENNLDLYASEEDCTLEIGKAVMLRDGNDAAILAAGHPAVQEAFQAAELLERDGIHARVLDMASVKPMDREAVVRAARETGAIVTVEDHNILGGLGGAVAEVLAEECPTRLTRIGVPDTFVALGPSRALYDRYRIHAPAIARTVIEFLKKK